MEQYKTIDKYITRFLTFLLCCSVVLNILLARKVEHLRELDRVLREEAQLQPDEVVPPIQAKDLDGNTIYFSYEGSKLPSIIYVLAPGCGWCEKNQSNVEFLAQALSDKYRFIALSLDSNGLKEYIDKHQLRFPVYSNIPNEVVQKYKFGGTPQTIVVSPEGKVIKNWRGAYSNNLKEEIENFFDILLPGLPQP